MQKEIKVGDNIVTLEIGKMYSGKKKPDANKKMVRKAIGFPATK